MKALGCLAILFLSVSMAAGQEPALESCASGDTLASGKGDYRRYASAPVALFTRVDLGPHWQNSTALCLFGDRVIWDTGFVPAKSIRVEGGELVYDSVMLAQIRDMRLSRDQIAAAEVVGRRLKLPSGGRMIGALIERHIPLNDLARRIGKGSLADRVESFEIADPNPGKVDFKAALYPGDDLKDRIRALAQRLGPRTVCMSGGELAPELSAYLDHISTAFRQSLDDFGSGRSYLPPTITIGCRYPRQFWTGASPSWSGMMLSVYEGRYYQPKPSR